jgi:hypothetical protein
MSIIFQLPVFLGFPNFANKTFANRTFANGESTVDIRQLAKVVGVYCCQCSGLFRIVTSEYKCRLHVACVELGCQDASYWFPLPTKSIEILLAHKLYWRKYSGHSPIGESHKGIFAKLQWTFANWRKSWEYIGESTVDIRQWRKSYWRKSYWRKSGKPFFSGN